MPTRLRLSENQRCIVTQTLARKTNVYRGEVAEVLPKGYRVLIDGQRYAEKFNERKVKPQRRQQPRAASAKVDPQHQRRPKWRRGTKPVGETMISPDQAPELVGEDRNALERKAIEDYFDRRLMAGSRTIQQTRSGWLKENIEAVIKDYRDLGWDVTGDGPWEFKKRARQ